MADDRRILESQTPLVIPEEPYTSPDGEKRWLRTVKVPLSHRGKPDCVLGIAIDISELKEVEEALKESEKQYKTLFNNAGDAIYIMDFEGNFLDTNTWIITGAVRTVRSHRRCRGPSLA